MEFINFGHISKIGPDKSVISSEQALMDSPAISVSMVLEWGLPIVAPICLICLRAPDKSS